MNYSVKELSVTQVQQLLVSSILPRPIAFVSTIDENGNRNLSPFSFFNAFGANPATLIFSPARRGRDNTTKDTFENIKKIPQAVVSIVSYEMVEQMSLASSEYPTGTDEFIKSGFTPIKANLVKPWLISEAPVQFECKVVQVIEMGQEGGSGNLVICEIVEIHVQDAVLNASGEIDPNKLRAVGRLGGNLYCKAFGEAIFELAKPSNPPGIGIDNLPESIRNSSILTGNQLGRLGNIKQLPSDQIIHSFITELGLAFFESKKKLDIHQLASHEIDAQNIEYALKLLLAMDLVFLNNK